MKLKIRFLLTTLKVCRHVFTVHYNAEKHQLHWICLDIAIENANQINQFVTVGINSKCNKCSTIN